MKIAWVTPYNTHSAIGRFSRLVVGGLGSAGHPVTIVRSEGLEVLAGADVLPGGEVVRWDAVYGASDFWRPFDAVVFNIGNYYRFHAGAVQLLSEVPGVVIVHDYFLLSLFLDWRQAHRAYGFADRIVDNLYDKGAAVRLHAAAGRPDWYEYTSEHFPMTEWIGRLGTGGVVHANFYADRLKRCCGGPVVVAPLAYDTLTGVRPLGRRRADSSVAVLTMGHVNRNKRVESVIRAIGGSDVLRDRCRYHVVGPVADDERERLTAVAQAMSFHGLEITGQVSDEVLRARIETADVICCLRWPVLEGASASTVEAMLSGRPTVVTDAGFYRDLPDDLVFKVDPRRELDSLTSQLTRLVLDPTLRAAVGARASTWAKSTFSVEGYVARLLPLLEEVARLRPTLCAAAHFGHLLADLGLGPNDPAVERLAASMQTLFMGFPTPSSIDANWPLK
jgi:glycosyltransferase involved in cell wall biosynthesis